jgi:hypothetical protein
MLNTSQQRLEAIKSLKAVTNKINRYLRYLFNTRCTIEELELLIDLLIKEDINFGFYFISDSQGDTAAKILAGLYASMDYQVLIIPFEDVPLYISGKSDKRQDKGTYAAAAWRLKIGK